MLADIAKLRRYKPGWVIRNHLDDGTWVMTVQIQKLKPVVSVAFADIRAPDPCPKTGTL